MMNANLRSCSGRFGLSLVEVLVAIAILAVGVLALAQFQAASLRNTALAEAISVTTRQVRGELEWQRQTAIDPFQDDCTLEDLPPGFTSCTVTILPCAYVFDDAGGGDLVCDAGASPSTYRVDVTAVGPRGQELTLRTLYTGIFVAGAAGTPPDALLTGED